MSWQPWTENLPVVDAGAARAAAIAGGGEVPEPTTGPSRLFRAGLTAEEEASAARTQGERRSAAEQERQAAYQEGMALARAENEALAVRYRAAIESLVTARDRAIETCERDMVRLSLTIAREVLMADVAGREQFAQKMAEHALHLVQASDRVALRMHSKDAAVLRQHKPELLARPGLTLVEDDALEVGDVRAEGDKGRVDATLQGRLTQMAQTLLGSSGPET